MTPFFNDLILYTIVFNSIKTNRQILLCEKSQFTKDLINFRKKEAKIGR